MLLAIDLGNTNITIGGFENPEKNALAFSARLTTDRQRTADQYAAELKNIISLKFDHLSAIDSAIISSVVPPLTDIISAAITALFGIKPLILGPGVKTGLNILIDNPAQLGADIVAVSVAAKELFPLPSAVCDLGTASTISVLDKNGNMLGGVIYPGVRTSLDALVRDTSLLQLISLEAPARVIGRGTVESMQAGVIFGAASLLDGMLERIEAELRQPVTAITTGGLAEPIVAHCKREFIYSENLVLLGLRMIYVKNAEMRMQK